MDINIDCKCLERGCESKKKISFSDLDEGKIIIEIIDGLTTTSAVITKSDLVNIYHQL